ncbi:MAG: dihydroorotate dehydrogenase-like protein [Bacteroidia bacterium]|nr:dihydroorotate dehydrogenase-like protein [Bacteroidia bacterium]
MADLKVKYLGIELKNPIIVGACNIVEDINNIRKVEEAGAAAIVYRSLFEEQIQLENYELHRELEAYNERNAEMIRLFPDIKHAGPEEFLVKLRKAKQSVSIPVIASLNAVYKETWLEYAKAIEETGVDAIELNFYAIPGNFDVDGKDIVASQLEIVREIKAELKIPVSVKLSPFYTSPLNFISKMSKAGAQGVVLFNRLFQPDIEINKEEHFQPMHLSNREDSRLALRFAGLLYGNIEAGICSNTGIWEGEDIIRMILAGADCVQVVSTLYKHKIGHISKMLSDINTWMESKNYHCINDFKAKLARKNIKDPFIYKRAQYIDMIMKSDILLKQYSLI